MHTAAASSARRKSSVGTKSGKQPSDLEDLIEEEVEPKNWKGIFIALFVIVIILGAVITTIALVMPDVKFVVPGFISYKEEIPLKKLSFTDFVADKYKPRKFDPVWLKGEDAFLYRNSVGELILVNCTSNVTSLFLSNSSFRELNTDAFIISPDRNYVLFLYNIRQISTFSRVFYAKILNKNTRLLTDLYGPFGYEFQYATWLPNENTIVFVQENNIYSRELNSEEIYVISKNGVLDKVYSGVPDWLYGERIFQSDNTLWISPVGSFLVYAEIDDSHVTKYKNMFYGDVPNQYPTVTSQSYPKAGTRNPTIKLKLFDLQKNRTHTLPPPTDFKNRDYYVTMVQWLTVDSVVIKWLNRAQNLSVFTICNATAASCRENFRYTADSVHFDTSNAIISSGGNEYFIILPQRHGSLGSYAQIASIDSKVSISNGKRLFLTTGKSEVVKLLGYDEVNSTLFYLAVPENNTKTRHLFSINVSRDKSTANQPECITCDVEGCDYVDASFSSSRRAYILGCLGPGAPYYDVYETPRKQVLTIEQNSVLQESLLPEMLPQPEYYQIPVPNTEEVISAKLLLPPAYKTEELLQYNMLVVLGQEPETRMVTQEFKIAWEHVMSSIHSIIIAYVDVRRDGDIATRGYRVDNHNYIERLAADDILTAVQYFKAMHFVHEVSCIYGSEYGGYLAASALTGNQPLLNCGLAVSPITDWRYMDTFYAEKYTDVPDSRGSPQTFNDASISKYASQIKGKSLMLIHSTGNQRVHFQHSAQLMKTLTKLGIPYQSQTYSDFDNLLSDNSIKSHVYSSMEKFVLNCFGHPRDDELAIIEDEEE